MWLSGPRPAGPRPQGHISPQPRPSAPPPAPQPPYLSCSWRLNPASVRSISRRHGQTYASPISTAPDSSASDIGDRACGGEEQKGSGSWEVREGWQAFCPALGGRCPRGLEALTPATAEWAGPSAAQAPGALLSQQW